MRRHLWERTVIIIPMVACINIKHARVKLMN